MAGCYSRYILNKEVFNFNLSTKEPKTKPNLKKITYARLPPPLPVIYLL